MAQKSIKQILPLLTQYKLNLQKKQIHIDHMIAFGSFAKDTPHPDSDIDVAIVSPNLSGDFTDDYVKLRTIVPNIDARIEPHPFLPQDFADKWNSLANEIKRTGIEI